MTIDEARELAVASMLVNVDMLFGSVQLVQTQKVEGSKIYMGGYAIHRDRDGKEVRRTENQWSCTLECGTPDQAEHWARLDPQEGA